MITTSEKILADIRAYDTVKTPSPVTREEPFGYFRSMPITGWEDCAATDEGAIALYERPAPVEVAEPVAGIGAIKEFLTHIEDITPDEVWEKINTRLWNRVSALTAPQPDRVAGQYLPMCQSLIKALKRLSFAAQTSGGTAGQDEELCAAISNAEEALSMTAVARAIDETSRVAELEAEVERLQALDVRKIMIDVTPGTGEGLEAFARSTDDIRRLLSALSEQRDAAQAEVERLRGLLAGLAGDIQGLISESDGVFGFHQNGDAAPWGELEAGGKFERLTHLPAALEEAGKEAQS